KVPAFRAGPTRADEDTADHPPRGHQWSGHEGVVAVVEPRVAGRDLLRRGADDDLAAPHRVGERRLHLEGNLLPGTHRLLRIPLARDEIEPCPVLAQRVDRG